MSDNLTKLLDLLPPEQAARIIQVDIEGWRVWLAIAVIVVVYSALIYYSIKLFKYWRKVKRERRNAKHS